MLLIRRNLTITRKTIIIGGTQIHFDYEIDDSIIEISGMLVITLEIPANVNYSQNVFGISLFEKKIKWQIEKRVIPFSGNQNFPCMSIFLDENRAVRAEYWGNTYFILDPFTGQILSEGLIR